MKEACQVCGYLTVEERGRFDICPVCFWEDDGFWADEHDPLMRCGPNHGLTIVEARDHYLRTGAVAADVIEYTRKPLPDEMPPADPAVDPHVDSNTGKLPTRD